MNGLKTLIHEIHRRSLWQVLGIFLAGSWGVIQVVDVLTERVGLPDWTPTMAVVLLLIGLPVVLATAFVQEGMTRTSPADTEHQSPAESAHNLTPGTGSLDRPSTRPSAGKRLLTWRNAIIGGVGAFTLLGVSLMAYFAMWTSGIGPVGNLVAQGVLEERDPVVLATFSDPTGAGLGDVVTEALRVDLLQSSVLSIVPAGRLSRALRLMDRPENESVTPQLALEIARREGYKAIIRGEVAAAGSAYVLSAAVVAAETGDELKAFRVTARSEDDLVDAIDKLSQDIREGTGETLRDIRAGAPLEEATTSSFQALRDLTLAERAEERGEDEEALRLLHDAVALDPAFAMAYRKIAVLYSNMGASPLLAREATLKAWEHRGRLTQRERYLAEAYYHSNITGDVSAQEAAYRNALRVAPDDGAALNNLALVLGRRGDFDEGIELLERAVSGPGLSSVAMGNLALYSFAAGDLEGGRAAVEAYEATFPNHSLVPFARVVAANASGDRVTMHALASEMASSPKASFRDLGAWITGFRDAADGKWREAQDHFAEAARIDREDDRPYEVLSVRLDALIVGGEVTGSAAYVTDTIDALGESFDGVAPETRPWGRMVVLLAAAGELDAAGRVYDAWPEDLFVSTKSGNDLFTRGYAGARLTLARGELEGAAREIETLRRELSCTVCYRQDLAEVYRQLGRVEEAIALLEPERTTRFLFDRWPLDRVLAARDIAPLYEAVGDTAAAIEAYRAFAEAWAKADPELRPHVRHARERITALGG
jgi:tetratricopeptide (TPR) repeat protein